MATKARKAAKAVRTAKKGQKLTKGDLRFATIARKK